VAALEKSLDLGNSSPVLRAFMYIELATDLSSKQAGKKIQTDGQAVCTAELDRTGLRLGGRGQDLRIQICFTDFYRLILLI
jgi:hypothetical protein